MVPTHQPWAEGEEGDQEQTPGVETLRPGGSGAVLGHPRLRFSRSGRTPGGPGTEGRPLSLYI